MSSKWFDNVFIPSLFERAGTNKSLWLSRKQTAICTENMEKHTIRQAQFQGDYTSHNYYTAEWLGRKVDLQYSKLNGCGTINFSMTPEESQASATAYKAEREAEKVNRREKMKSTKPERIAFHMDKATAKVKQIREELEDLKKELSEATEKGLIADIKEDISLTEQELNDAQKELDFWIA